MGWEGEDRVMSPRGTWHSTPNACTGAQGVSAAMNLGGGIWLETRLLLACMSPVLKGCFLDPRHQIPAGLRVLHMRTGWNQPSVTDSTGSSVLKPPPRLPPELRAEAEGRMCTVVSGRSVSNARHLLGGNDFRGRGGRS